MLRYALDTNFCIHVLRGRAPALRARFNAEAEALSISTIVLMELLQGAGRSARPAETRSAVAGFAARLAVLDFNADAAGHAADIAASLHKAGLPIGAYDTLIAGHARSRGLIIVTSNLREFSRVEGLRCEDWLA